MLSWAVIVQSLHVPAGYPWKLISAVQLVWLVLLIPRKNKAGIWSTWS